MTLGRSVRRYFTTSSKQGRLLLSNLQIKELHGRNVRTHQYRNPNAMAEVIKRYALSQTSLQKAHFAFNEIYMPTLPIWNYMIRGYGQSENFLYALYMFDEMRERGMCGDNLTFIFVCKACARAKYIIYGKRVHGLVLKLGFGSYLYLCNALIHMYGSCGELCFSRKVFDEMGVKDLVSWNSLICGYSQHAKYKVVLDLFYAMRLENIKADAVTMVKVVLASRNLGEWKLVDSIVKYIEDNCVEIDVFLGNTLIDVYGGRGSIALAREIFDNMKEKNCVSWNAMIIGSAKSGDLVAAKKLFDEMPKRDVVSWTCMISSYAQAKQHNDAISVFQEMMVSSIKPDEITIASVLSCCAHLRTLDVGEAVHEYIRKNHITSDIYVENTLIDLYCKCGSIDKALTVFQEMKDKDSVSWTSVICGLAMNGEYNRAITLFSQMIKQGTRPIHGTFLGVLLACVHGGLVDKGLEFFLSMQRNYRLVPELRHYGCIVDLFCRAGEIRRAYEFILSMPIVPDAVVWRMLLSSCKLHGDLVLAKIASDKLIELDPSNGGNYALSSNVYASSERWSDAFRMREVVYEGEGVLKPLGWSSIEMNYSSFK